MLATELTQTVTHISRAKRMNGEGGVSTGAQRVLGGSLRQTLGAIACRRHSTLRLSTLHPKLGMRHVHWQTKCLLQAIARGVWRIKKKHRMPISKQVHGWASVTQSFLSNLGSWVRFPRQFGLVARRLLGHTLATNSRPLTALTKPADILPILPPSQRFA